MMIDIAVPTFNAAKYFDQFMASLLSQTCTSWRVITRDDGSSDGTQALAKAWANRLGERFVIIENLENVNLGVSGNYSAILEKCDSDFVMTGDQDDVWLEDKIEKSIDRLRMEITKYGDNFPILVCSDAEVVDENLRVVERSLLRWQRTTTWALDRLSRVVMENAVPGPTILMNRSLLDIALPIPSGAVYQDWWLALVCCKFGRIFFLKEVTVKYRRHGKNTSSTPQASSILAAIKKVKKLRLRARSLLPELGRQATAFLRQYEFFLSEKDKSILLAASSLEFQSGMKIRYNVIRYRLFFGSVLKTVGFLVFI